MLNKTLEKVCAYALSLVILMLLMNGRGDGATDVRIGVTRVPKISILVSRFTPQGASSVPGGFLDPGGDFFKQGFVLVGIFGVAGGGFSAGGNAGVSAQP